MFLYMKIYYFGGSLNLFSYFH